VGRLYTVGHSTRTSEELLALLGGAGVRRLVDVRRQPGSRRHPRFAQAALRQALARADIAYVHEPDLGGRRDPRAGSPNTAWRHAAFRGYADHMATPAFAAALGRVIAGASEPQALMCAEAVPWRCHRQLVADALVARGLEVEHILAPGRTSVHVLRPEARVTRDGFLVYEGGRPPVLPFTGPNE
jgi:uncharacterized protein (DUF488 family)